jgi:hypothetical protein
MYPFNEKAGRPIPECPVVSLRDFQGTGFGEEGAVRSEPD